MGVTRPYRYIPTIFNCSRFIRFLWSLLYSYSEYVIFNGGDVAVQGKCKISSSPSSFCGRNGTNRLLDLVVVVAILVSQCKINVPATVLRACECVVSCVTSGVTVLLPLARPRAIVALGAKGTRPRRSGNAKLVLPSPP